MMLPQVQVQECRRDQSHPRSEMLHLLTDHLTRTLARSDAVWIPDWTTSRKRTIKTKVAARCITGKTRVSTGSNYWNALPVKWHFVLNATRRSTIQPTLWTLKNESMREALQGLSEAWVPFGVWAFGVSPVRHCFVSLALMVAYSQDLVRSINFLQSSITFSILKLFLQNQNVLLECIS